MKIQDAIEVKWNLQIDLYERGKKRPWHHRTHNIVLNTGRQMFCELITASSFSGASYVRHQDSVVRYIGFGIGGVMQNNPAALASPYSDPYPTGYSGTNVQTDTDVTVSRLERPVQVSPDVWMRQVSTPGTFPTATSTRFIATFAEADLNFGSFTSVPISEIGLYKSSADPSLPNGAAGAYPGAGGHTVAYDTFNTISKTGVFSIQVLWELRF